MNTTAPQCESLIQEGAEVVPWSIHGAMRHSAFAGDKRLRSVLAMLAVEF